MAKKTSKKTSKKAAKKAAKKSAKKAASKKVAKKVASKVTKKAATKKVAKKVAKKAAKKASKKKAASKPKAEVEVAQEVEAAPAKKKKSKKPSAKLGKKVSIRVNPELLKKRKSVKEEAPEEEVFEEEDPGLTVAQLKKCKSGLSKADIKSYKENLLEHRDELLSDVEALRTETNNQSGNLSSVPVHMADLGSDSYEQERTLGLIESDRKLLGEIQEALDRIEEGYYGVCVETGEPIGKARLDAKPWAKYTIDVVKEKERLGQI